MELGEENQIAVINANALHCASGDPYCKLQSLVFSPLLITGNVNSAFASRYILPLISCTRFSGIVLKNKKASASNCFSIAFEALKNDAFAYEFTVREQLGHIMLATYSELEPQQTIQKNSKNFIFVAQENTGKFIKLYFKHIKN